MNNETYLLIPMHTLVSSCSVLLTHHVPSRGLPSSRVCLRLLGFFPKSCSTIWILLSHGFPVRQVLCSIDDHHQSANLRSIYRHVGVYACCVHLEDVVAGRASRDSSKVRGWLRSYTGWLYVAGFAIHLMLLDTSQTNCVWSSLKNEGRCSPLAKPTRDDEGTKVCLSCCCHPRTKSFDRNKNSTIPRVLPEQGTAGFSGVSDKSHQVTLVKRIAFDVMEWLRSSKRAGTDSKDNHGRVETPLIYKTSV